jgi:hypothetical protein
MIPGSYRVAAYDDLGRSDYSNVVVSPIIEIVIPTNPLNKSVEQSEYTESLSYEIIWVVGNEELSAVSFSYTKNSVTKTVDEVDLCNSYGRICLVWTDKNGITDYSEWSVPTGSKPGTNSNLVDKTKTPNCPEL